MQAKELLHKAEIVFDHTKLRIKKKFNLFEPFIIYPYVGYANDKQIHVMARVLEKEGILHSEDEPDSIRKKLHYMLKRYESDEIPYAETEIKIGDDIHHIKANEEGFIDVILPLPEAFRQSEENWHKVQFTLKSNPYTKQEEVKAEGDIMKPSPTSAFGIISDVDDTIIQSFATNTYLKIKTLLFNNASGRVPFEGVDEFYKSLQTAKGYFNPLLFISGSTWNIYDLLHRFCMHHNIPKAPFLLREFGIDSNFFFQRATQVFKKEKIKHLLEFYPDLPFIFIGDSGQHDPEIYGEIAKEFPDRVKAIYIRKNNSASLSVKRKTLQKSLNQLGITILFIEDTIEALKHAKNMGFV